MGPDALTRNAEELRQYPSALEGIDMGRIDAFFQEHNLSPDPVIVIYEDKEKSVARLLPERVRKDWPLTGARLHEYGLSIVVRNRTRERLNGVVHTEGIVVHELAHSTNKMESSCGAFLEEGFADYTRKLYLERAKVKPYQQHVTAPGGHEIDGIYGFLTEVWESDGECTHPYKKWRTFSSALTAAGLETLMAHIPELWVTMVQARYSSSARSKMQALLNGASSGLYEVLENCEYSEQDFEKAFTHIAAICRTP